MFYSNTMFLNRPIWFVHIHKVILPYLTFLIDLHRHLVERVNIKVLLQYFSVTVDGKVIIITMEI